MTAGASAPEDLVEAVIAKLAPTQGVDAVRVTDEDEYFPPPRELRELIPALDAVAAFAFGGDPATRARTGRTPRRRSQPRRVRGARSARSLAGAVPQFERLVERLLQGLGELRGERVDLGTGNRARRARRRHQRLPHHDHDATEAREPSLPLRMISSVPAIPTGTIGTLARNAR